VDRCYSKEEEVVVEVVGSNKKVVVVGRNKVEGRYRSRVVVMVGEEGRWRTRCIPVGSN
jgi:hypothetical protein